MNRTKWLLAGLLITVTAPILAVSTLGRLEIDWPDYGDPGGAQLVTTIQDSVSLMSNNVPSRISENTAVADSTTVTVTHNFGLNLADLSLKFYLGVGGSKVLTEPVGAGYTIADNVGDPKNKIDITTPISGGPHDFSTVLLWGGGASSPINSFLKNFELAEDIVKGQFVKIIDDAGTAKISSLIAAVPITPAYGQVLPQDPFGYESAVAYAGTPGSYVVIYTPISGDSQMVVAQVSGGTITYSSPQTLTGFRESSMDAVWNPIAGNIVMVSKGSTSALLTYRVLTVSGTTITVEDTFTDTPLYTGSVRVTYNSYLGACVALYRQSSTNYVRGASSVGNSVFLGTQFSTTNPGNIISEVAYSKIHDSVIVAVRNTAGNTPYTLLRQTTLSSFTILDSATNSIQTVNGSMAEDETNGGILYITRDAAASTNTKVYPINISGDTLAFGSVTTVSTATSSPFTSSSVVYNTQLGTLVIVHPNGTDPNMPWVGTADTTPTAISTTLYATPSPGWAPATMIRSSTYSEVGALICGVTEGYATITCQYLGGNIQFSRENNVGVFVSPNTLSGGSGDVLLYGGTSDEISGTIGAPIYIGDDGLLTETPAAEQVGVFLEANKFQIQKPY